MYHYYHYNPMGFANTGAAVKVIAQSDAETKLKYPRFVRISRRLAEQIERTGAGKIPEVYMNSDNEPIWRYNERSNTV